MPINQRKKEWIDVDTGEREEEEEEERERKKREKKGKRKERIRESYLCTPVIPDYNESTVAAPRMYSSHTDCRGTS